MYSVINHPLRTRQHEFFSIRLPLCDIKNGTFHPGTLCYPFCIDLPESLPSSSIYRVGLGEVGFHIQYKLTARLGIYTKTSTIPVAAKELLSSKAPFKIQPTTHLITSFGGAKKGLITLACNVDTTNVRKGESLTVSLSCRNESVAKIQRVELKVVELLNWGSKEGYNKSRLFKQTLVKVGGIDLPGVQRESDRKTQLIDATYRTVEEQNAMHTSMDNDLKSSENDVSLECPLRVRDSYAGALIDIRHYLKIKLVTASGTTSPSIKIPLNIGLPAELPGPGGMEVVPFHDGKDKTMAVPMERFAPQLLPISSSAVSPSPFPYSEKCERERELEPMPPPKVLYSDVLERDDGNIEVDMSSLIPMLPPQTST